MAKRKKRPTEGTAADEQLQQMCDNARDVVEVCDALGFEFRGGNKLLEFLHGAMHAGVSIDTLKESPDPQTEYIWDEED